MLRVPHMRPRALIVAAHLLAEPGAAVHLAMDVCAGTEFLAEELVVADVCNDERQKIGRPHRRRGGGGGSWQRGKGGGSRVDGVCARVPARDGPPAFVRDFVRRIRVPVSVRMCVCMRVYGDEEASKRYLRHGPCRRAGFSAR